MQVKVSVEGRSTHNEVVYQTRKHLKYIFFLKLAESAFSVFNKAIMLDEISVISLFNVLAHCP